MERTTNANKAMTLDELRDAVRQVLAYLHEDERSHYENSDPNARQGHIFKSLERLRTWLEAKEHQDEADALRCCRLEAINGQPGSRAALEAQYGQVWDTQELQRDFAVLGFQAPYVVVCRNSDSQRGSLEFQHQPRLYFNFKAD